MRSSWKHIYPWIEATVVNLDSVALLLQQTVGVISATYKADCLLWVDPEATVPESICVYATARASRFLKSHTNFESQPDPPHVSANSSRQNWHQVVQKFYPRSLPKWLIEQKHLPQIAQLDTGELLIPITSGDSIGMPSIRRLQFVLQLSRPLAQLQSTQANVRQSFSADLGFNGRVRTTLKSLPPKPAPTPFVGWSLEEVRSLEVVGSQLLLAHNVLYWRQRLEQSRQQAALVGRIARLLNSSLNPDEIVGRIVAELGQGLEGDRCILVDLRSDPVNILAIWDHPERYIQSLEQRQTDRSVWRNVIDMFLQSGASYLELELNQQDVDPLQNWLQEVGASSVLIVPLFIQEEFFGAVLLLSYQQGRVYELDELQTIRQVADQAAIALTNAQHYQSLWYKQEALRLQNNTLQLETIQDGLTGLLNRRSLEREIEQLSAAAVWSTQKPFCVIVCDIDYFKFVNDTHGHLVGDEVLQELANRLQKQLRQGTPAYRYGGEEFVIILTETSLREAVDVAERLRSVIRAKPLETAVGAIAITASFGIAQQDSTQDPHAWGVIQRADQALYEAKRQGRDRVVAL